MYKECKSLLCGLKQDWVESAPCPPPLLEYEGFFEHALLQNLSDNDVCEIGRKCHVNGTFTDIRCSRMTTTTTKVTTKIPPTTIRTTSSANFSTEATTSSKPLTDSNEFNTLYLILPLLAAFCIIIGIIILIVKRKKKCKTRQENVAANKTYNKDHRENVAAHNEGFDDETLRNYDTINENQGAKGNDEDLGTRNESFINQHLHPKETTHSIAMEHNSDSRDEYDMVKLHSNINETDKANEENAIFFITHL